MAPVSPRAGLLLLLLLLLLLFPSTTAQQYIPGALGTWSLAPSTGPPPTGPLAAGTALAGCVLLAGAPPVGSAPTTPLSQYDLSNNAWSAPPPAPLAVVDLAPLGGLLVALGSGWASLAGLPHAVWAAGWTVRALTGLSPPRSAAAGAMFGGTYILFGGNRDTPANPFPLGDVWAVDSSACLLNSTATACPWVQLQAAGAGGVGPQARYGHTLTTYSDDVVVFGGTNGATLFNDAWELTPGNTGGGLGGGAPLLSWTLLPAAGTAPPPRAGHAAAILADELYVFGGYGVGGGALSDLWVLDIGAGAWAPVVVSGVLPVVYGGGTANAAVFLGHFMFLGVSAAPASQVTLYKWTVTDVPPGGAGGGVTVILPEQGIQAGLVIQILLTIVVIVLQVRAARRAAGPAPL